MNRITLTSIILIILLSFPLQAYEPQTANKYVYGRFWDASTAYSDAVLGGTGLMVGEGSKSYRILPKELYPKIRHFLGKRVVVRGQAVFAPGMQNTIKISSELDIVLQQQMIIRGTVIEGKVGYKKQIFLKVNRRLYKTESDKVTAKLKSFLDQDVKVTCYLSGPMVQSTTIVEITDISSDEKPVTEFSYPCRNYRRELNKGVLFASPQPSEGDDKIRYTGDILPLRTGSKITAIADGTIMYADTIPSAGSTPPGPEGLVIVEHLIRMGEQEVRICSLYGFLTFPVPLKIGQRVKRNQVIGTTGTFGSEKPGFFFALHTGPYYQLSPWHKGEISSIIEASGLPAGGGIIKGEIQRLEHTGKGAAEVQLKGSVKTYTIDLHTLPEIPAGSVKPVPVMGWFAMTAEPGQLVEWIDPVAFLKDKAK